MNPNFNFLVVPPEPKSVTEAIVKVLQDKEYARKLGLNGERFVSKFNWDNIAYDLERVLIQVCMRGEME
jgi:glycosyltransferase involved in cell wall biosynthesis